MKRHSDSPYVWLEAALNVLVGAGLLAIALTPKAWSAGWRVSTFGAGLVFGVLCLARAWRVVARH